MYIYILKYLNRYTYECKHAYVNVYLDIFVAYIPTYLSQPPTIPISTPLLYHVHSHPTVLRGYEPPRAKWPKRAKSDATPSEASSQRSPKSKAAGPRSQRWMKNVTVGIAMP